MTEQAEQPFLLRERRGGVLIVSMNAPESRNAITEAAQIDEFDALAADLAADRSIRAVVLTGNGASFCAGGNIKDMRDRRGMFAGGASALRDNYRSVVQRVPQALGRIEVPIVAAINGPAIGLGFDLACMCDIRLCADTASFAQSFVKLGLVSGVGGTWFLPRIVGGSRAALMALTGMTIAAEEALAWGLVARVVAADELSAAAIEIAAAIAANPGHAVRMTKRLLRDGVNADLGMVLESAAAFQAIAQTTQDHHEAVCALLERRKPRYVDA